MPIRSRVALVALVFATACTGSGATEATGEVNVFAAASLGDVFAELEETFEAQAPGVDVRLNIAGSSALREQILAGAPADVFASANRSVMDDVVAAGAANQPQDFVRNSLIIGVPEGNPAGVTSLDDFANPDLLLGACAAGVPCGDGAHRLFDGASVMAQLDTTEPDVRALTTKLVAGELDAGIVYLTNATASPDVDVAYAPASAEATVTYPIAPLNDATNREAAIAFVNFVFSQDAQMILKRSGFLPLDGAG